MKRDSRYLKTLIVPKEAVDTLRVARQGDIMRPTLGQMATAAIMEKYGQQKPVQVAAVPEAEDWAKRLLDDNAGNKSHAMAGIPVGHPMRVEIVRAIERLA